jgi:hypothetical protein
VKSFVLTNIKFQSACGETSGVTNDARKGFRFLFSYQIALEEREHRRRDCRHTNLDTKKETSMRKFLIVSAALLLSSAAYAQSGTGPAAQSGNMQKPGMNTMEKGSMQKGSSGNMGTTGMSGTRPSAGNPSNSGAPTAAGPNNMGSQTEPGAVKNGANGR